MKKFIYCASVRRTVMDVDLIESSGRTFDIKVFDLANNEKLCGLLNLYYMQGSFFFPYNYQSRGEWFCGYISGKNGGEEEDAQYQKLLTNPIVRILVTDSEILTKIKNLLPPEIVI